MVTTGPVPRSMNWPRGVRFPFLHDLQEDVFLQLLLDLVLQLDHRALQDLHRLDHLRRLNQSLLGPELLAKT